MSGKVVSHVVKRTTKYLAKSVRACDGADYFTSIMDDRYTVSVLLSLMEYLLAVIARGRDEN